jgi:hypothetical protein
VLIAADAKSLPAAEQQDVLSRATLFGVLYLLGILNALAAVVFHALPSEGGWQAQVRDLNIVVLATIVGLYLLRPQLGLPVRRGDWALVAVVAVLLLVPHRAASWLAVTSVALYAIARDRRSTSAVAAASVFLAIAASSFWGLVLLQAFGPTLLAWDAALAALLLGLLEEGAVERVGNVIVTSDQTMLIVLTWCASLPNLLYGLLCWTVIARALRPAWRRADGLALLAVGGLVVAANTLRLALMGLSADSYEWVHGWVGGHVFNIGLLLVIAAIALCSTRPAASALPR